MAWIIGGFIGIGLFLLFYLRSGAMGCRYTWVPDGLDWRTFYRQTRDKKKGNGRITWVIIGGGLGMAVIAAIIAAVS